MATLQRNVQKSEFIVELELSSINPPTWKLRPLDDKTVNELERSIKNTGLLQPIVVRRNGPQYEVVFGNHRLLACKRLGMEKIKTIIMDFTDEESFLARVAENLIRNSHVDPLEEAKGYKMLIQRGWTVNAIGRRVGKCDSYVSERLALQERLSPNLRTKIASGAITPSHAELLARIRDHAKQNLIAELITRKKLSVRTLEAILSVAPPSKTQVVSISGEYYAKIPLEFMEAMKLNTTRSLLMYMRGNKLILEGADRGSGRRPRIRRVNCS